MQSAAKRANAAITVGGARKGARAGMRMERKGERLGSRGDILTSCARDVTYRWAWCRRQEGSARQEETGHGAGGRVGARATEMVMNHGDGCTAMRQVEAGCRSWAPGATAPAPKCSSSSSSSSSSPSP